MKMKRPIAPKSWYRDPTPPRVSTHAWQPPIEVSSCHGAAMEIQRDKVGFHACFWVGLLMFLVTWLAIPFIPKRHYCRKCNKQCTAIMLEQGQVVPNLEAAVVAS